MSQARSIGLALVLALFGFLVATAFAQERGREQATPQQRAELEELIEARRETIATLARDVDRLSRRIQAVQTEVGEGSEQVESAVRRVERLGTIAGLDPLQGPGVVVELADADREARTRDELTDLRIQDLDLQLVANELWRAGAEAISVNGRRLIATTAIRKAGSAILVNYRAVASPYRVVAVGDPDALRRGLLGSEIAERFDVWRDIYGLGFSVQTSDDLRMPALRGLPGFEHARPAEGGG